MRRDLQWEEWFGTDGESSRVTWADRYGRVMNVAETDYEPSTPDMERDIERRWIAGARESVIALETGANPAFVAAVVKRTRKTIRRDSSQDWKDEQADRIIGFVLDTMTRINAELAAQFDVEKASLALKYAERLAKLVGADEAKKVEHGVTDRTPRSYTELQAALKARGVSEERLALLGGRPGRPSEN